MAFPIPGIKVLCFVPERFLIIIIDMTIGGLEVKVGLLLLAIGLGLVAFTYSTYLLATKKYSHIKKEDLVSYYIDLAKYLYPVPFWSGVIGVVMVLIAVIVVLVNIPFAF